MANFIPQSIWVSFDRSISTCPFVCWYRRRWPINSCFCPFFFLSLPFFVASDSPPTALDPPTPPLKPSSPHDRSTQLALPIALSVAFVIFLLSAMGFLFRFLWKMRRKRSGNQVSGDPDAEKGKDCGDAGDGSVRKFTWAEINEATVSFSRLIGSGGYSNVYLARFPGSGDGAVKVHACGESLTQNFKQELDVLLHLSHDNIVKLLGFCDDRGSLREPHDEAAMVFEYIPNGNLQEKLKETEFVLPWRNRTAIVFQLAQAIEYLHEKCSPQIVHGDIKASNVLLDERLNCKLCDFGSAKVGFSSTVLPPSSRTKQQVMIGSPGYTDPHYLRTGIASKKNDVYSLGVIILQMVTGKEVFCLERGKLLSSMMEPMLNEMAGDKCEVTEEKVAEVVDPRLGGEFELQEVKQMLAIAALCLRQSPSLRPSATQIGKVIKETIPYVAPHKEGR